MIRAASRGNCDLAFVKNGIYEIDKRRLLAYLRGMQISPNSALKSLWRTAGLGCFFAR